jgi:hypothetical protein
MAESIQNLLEPGGVVFVSAPFCWRIHGYPDDFWRFTPSGIRLMFRQIAFDDHDCCLSTTKPNDFYGLNDFPRSEFDTAKGMERGQYGPVTATIIRLLWRYQIMPWLVRWPYLYPPILVNMIGRKQPG